MSEGGSSRSVVSLFRSKLRSGPWPPGQPIRAVAVFGSLTLNLKELEGGGQDTEVSATALFGDVRMVVRDDASVELSGIAIFGDKRSMVSEGSSPPKRHVRVKGLAVFGDVEVVDSMVASS